MRSGNDVETSVRYGRLSRYFPGRAWVALGAALMLLAPLAPVAARTDPPPQWVASVSGTIAESQLPPPAVRVLAAIRQGGPFPYGKDGVIFGNREHLLPRQPRGYYHEYTVPTPRAHNRGARRIVCGGVSRSTSECYYTDDHYNSFKRIQG